MCVCVCVWEERRGIYLLVLGAGCLAWLKRANLATFGETENRAPADPVHIFEGTNDPSTGNRNWL